MLNLLLHHTRPSPSSMASSGQLLPGCAVSSRRWRRGRGRSTRGCWRTWRTTTWTAGFPSSNQVFRVQFSSSFRSVSTRIFTCEHFSCLRGLHDSHYAKNLPPRCTLETTQALFELVVLSSSMFARTSFSYIASSSGGVLNCSHNQVFSLRRISFTIPLAQWDEH